MNKNTTLAEQTEAFVKAITELPTPSPLALKLFSHFCDEMNAAVEYGRICTPERMAKLYPIFREINMEMDDMETELSASSLRHRRS